MRCPKCHYLSFEPEPRCRNCGYELSLSAPDFSLRSADLAIKPSEEPSDAFPDFDLQLPAAAPPLSSDPLGSIDLDSMVGFSKTETVLTLPPAAAAVAPPVAPSVAVAVSAPATAELPLFVQSRPLRDDGNDEPMVKLPPAPRAPLGVRRPTPDPARLRAKYPRVAGPGGTTRDLLDLQAANEPAPVPAADRPISRPPMEAPPAVAQDTPEPEPVGAGRRLEAALIDLAFIGAIDVALVWLTLRVCGLPPSDVGILPVVPLSAFLFLLDAGYLLMFTAVNGQTVGKMIAHIRVVGTSAAEILTHRVSLGQAALRAVMTLPSVLALGLGFLPALIGEGRAVHDRIAHTRVVRA